MLHLLKSMRFFPLFITQLLGAFNDNVFKNALIVFITYHLTFSAKFSDGLVSFSTFLFIFPFFLFSAVAGKLADNLEKSRLITLIKMVEVMAMSLAYIGFIYSNFTILLFTLFVLGSHSAFFGPVKYAILPEQLEKEELISANALIESSTFLAILLGTLLGGALIVWDKTQYSLGAHLTGALCLSISILGFIASLLIKKTHTFKSKPRPSEFSLRIFHETKNLLIAAKDIRKVYLSILGISWFWLIGIVFLTKFPSIVKSVIYADHQVLTCLFSIFSIGIAIGSLLSDRLQKKQIHAHYVPTAILLMSVFIFDFAMAIQGVAPSETPMGLSVFLSQPMGLRLLLDILCFSILGGIYVVPLYTILQYYSPPENRAKMLAANNVMNALFMVVVTLVMMALGFFGVTHSTQLLLMGIINIGIGLFIFKLLPDSFIKTWIKAILKYLYRIEIRGVENLSSDKLPVLVVANHISFLDGILLGAFLPGKFLFVVNQVIAGVWWIKPFLSLVPHIAIDPFNPFSTKTIIKTLKGGESCVIFPEGRLTVTGALMKIYDGAAMMADKAGVPIVPVRIDGSQYTPFSRLKGKFQIRFFPKITITILPQKILSENHGLPPKAHRKNLGTQLYDIMSDLIFETSDCKTTLFAALLSAQTVHHPSHKILQDPTKEALTYRQLIRNAFVIAQSIRGKSEPSEVIGILMPNSVAAVLFFMGCQAARLVPAMLNYSTGIQNLISACKTANIRQIYTSRKFVQIAKLSDSISTLQLLNIDIIYAEDLLEALPISAKITGFIFSYFPAYAYRFLGKPGPEARPEYNNPAVILFTSGSEGTPKGVVLSHKNLLSNIYQLSARIDFNPKDIVLNALPIFHSFGMTAGLLLPLLLGVRTFLYPSPLHYRVIPELLYDNNASIFFATDTFLSGYARYANPYDFYSVRYIFCGAERLKPETQKIWFENFGKRIFEGYGATETAPVLSMNTPMHNKVGTVGRLLPDIDYKLEKIPGIEKGEKLWVSGPNVMLGYLKIDNPGVLEPLNEGWYDTGDIVSMDENHFITIEGRAKRFAKIGGEMVSLVAVESAVKALWPEYEHAVIAISDPKKGEALVLITQYPDPDRKALLRHFKNSGLTELQMPREIVSIDKLPILGTGKVDYVGLANFIASRT